MNYKAFLLFRVFNFYLSRFVILDFRDDDLKPIEFNTVRCINLIVIPDRNAIEESYDSSMFLLTAKRLMRILI